LMGTRWHVNNARIAEAAKLIEIAYDNKVELIQFNGVKAWSQEVSNPEDLWLSDDGSKIAVRSENKILRFEKVNLKSIALFVQLEIILFGMMS